MASVRYLALLRGINVGGKNIIKMADLAASFQDLGFAEVVTYIQSGNVVFRSGESNAAELAGSIERALSARFAYASRVVLLSHQHLRHIVERAPGGFGEQPDKYRYNVFFLKEPLSAAEVLGSLSLKPGVDTAHEGRGVLYFSLLTSKATQSHISRINMLPSYPLITIRNWNTTIKLLALMDKT